MSTDAPHIAEQDALEVTCVMTHTDPFDFAQCETHDTTFALGDRCKFYGREPVEVYEEEAREQRGRAVVAEVTRDQALDLLALFRDEDECRWDHHRQCQTHGPHSELPPGICANGRNPPHARHRQRGHLVTAPTPEQERVIDLGSVWLGEEEDEFGNALPGLILPDLRRVIYGEQVWVTTAWEPTLMLRADVLDIDSYTFSYAEHRPGQMWYAHARPVAQRTKQLFWSGHLPVLRHLGVRVLPLVPGAVASPSNAIHGHFVHALMRGEDWIGFVMARKSNGVPLPDDLMVRDLCTLPAQTGGKQS